VRTLTSADWILLVSLVVATGLSYLFLGALVDKGSEISVEVDGKVVYHGSLSDTTTFSVHGARGDLLVSVQNGSVAVVRADCPNRICMRMGRRSRAGDIIVCVPNRTILRIVGKDDGKVRAVTG
jgi:hypothetical protein